MCLDTCTEYESRRWSVVSCQLIDNVVRREGKIISKDIVNMLMGLIKSNSDRTYEPGEEYNP